MMGIESALLIVAPRSGCNVYIRQFRAAEIFKNRKRDHSDQMKLKH